MTVVIVYSYFCDTLLICEALKRVPAYFQFAEAESLLIIIQKPWNTPNADEHIQGNLYDRLHLCHVRQRLDLFFGYGTELVC